MPGKVRVPRLRVTVDGAQIAGAVGAEVQSNNHFSADRFRLQIASSAAPHLAFIAPDQRVEIAFGLDDIWRPIIVGRADTVSLDPVSRVINIEGRDLSSMLVDTQTEDSFANRTASEIATLMAERHGLSVIADPTSTPVGRYYQSEHDRVTLGQFAKATTEWDLLAFLAAREGFDLFMSGATLRFAASAIDAATALTVEDCVSLRMERCVGLARPIEVTVKSWGSRAGTRVSSKSRAEGVGTATRRDITRPNLTTDDAQKLAQRVIADLKRHEWSVELTMPGELLLSPRSRVFLAGITGPWNRIYSVTQIVRHIDIKRGFTQHLTLQGAA